jgi:hypothetical protein
MKLLRPLSLFAVFAGTIGTYATAQNRPADEPDPKPRVVLPDESKFTASASDGKGAVTVAPDTVPVSSPVTMTFVYTAAGEGIAVGGGVVCNVSNFWGWTPPQTRIPQAPGFVTAICSDPAVTLETDANPRDNTIVVRVAGRPLAAGQTITLVYGDTSGGQFETARGTSDRYAERGERFFFKVDGDGDGYFTPIAPQATFRVEATQAVRLATFGPSHATVGEPFEITVAALDPTYNLVERFAGEVKLEALWADAECHPSVTLTEADRGAVRVKVTPREAGPLRIGVEDAAGKLSAALTNPIVVTAAGADSLYTPYWGDLQGHCNVCDGSASPEEFYRYARDVTRLDVVALTDHDHWGYAPLDEDPATWEKLLELSRANNEPGRFVAFPAYEWTNWTYGHKHVIYLREEDAKVFPWHRPASDHPQELWKLLGGRDCLTFSHHPGGGPIPTFWKYHDASFEPVVEMASVHGVSEAMGHPRCIYSPEPSGMAQAALARGYRLGMIGSGDTHDGHPGLGSPGARAGLAGIYAKELTREGIFEALRARRVYATTGCRAVLRFHMGATPMGGVAKLSSPDERRAFSVMVLGDAAITAITVVKNNEPAAVHEAGGFLASFDWTDPAPAKDGDYYYARVTQADGEWIWSSPIFIELTSD